MEPQTLAQARAGACCCKGGSILNAYGGGSPHTPPGWVVPPTALLSGFSGWLAATAASSWRRSPSGTPEGRGWGGGRAPRALVCPAAAGAPSPCAAAADGAKAGAHCPWTSQAGGYGLHSPDCVPFWTHQPSLIQRPPPFLLSGANRTPNACTPTTLSLPHFCTHHVVMADYSCSTSPRPADVPSGGHTPPPPTPLQAAPAMTASDATPPTTLVERSASRTRGDWRVGRDLLLRAVDGVTAVGPQRPSPTTANGPPAAVQRRRTASGAAAAAMAAVGPALVGVEAVVAAATAAVAAVCGSAGPLVDAPGAGAAAVVAGRAFQKASGAATAPVAEAAAGGLSPDDAAGVGVHPLGGAADAVVATASSEESSVGSSAVALTTSLVTEGSGDQAEAVRQRVAAIRRQEAAWDRQKVRAWQTQRGRSTATSGTSPDARESAPGRPAGAPRAVSDGTARGGYAPGGRVGRRGGGVVGGAPAPAGRRPGGGAGAVPRRPTGAPRTVSDGIGRVARAPGGGTTK